MDDIRQLIADAITEYKEHLRKLGQMAEEMPYDPVAAHQYLRDHRTMLDDVLPYTMFQALSSMMEMEEQTRAMTVLGHSDLCPRKGLYVAMHINDSYSGIKRQGWQVAVVEGVNEVTSAQIYFRLLSPSGVAVYFRDNMRIEEWAARVAAKTIKYPPYAVNRCTDEDAARVMNVLPFIPMNENQQYNGGVQHPINRVMLRKLIHATRKGEMSK